VIQSGDQFIAGRSCTVAYMPRDADLAFFSIPGACCRPTDLGIFPGLERAAAPWFRMVVWLDFCSRLTCTPARGSLSQQRWLCGKFWS